MIARVFCRTPFRSKPEPATPSIFGSAAVQPCDWRTHGRCGSGRRSGITSIVGPVPRVDRNLHYAVTSGRLSLSRFSRV
jgi:hypothetical protein